MKFNINQYVTVKLTDYGKTVYSKYWAKYGIFDYCKYDDDGYLKIQLWELMGMFGNELYTGCQLPFDTEIELEIQDN